MIHPVFRLAASQPLLLAEHAAAYSGLVSEELAAQSARLKRRLALQLAGAACLLVAVVLAGVALLLWASLPEAGFRAPWLLVLTPALPAALGLWALWLAQERESGEPFANLRLQLAQDAALLRTPAAP
jgi:ABC-type nickel/cobalt efflux system permease component RcnA